MNKENKAVIVEEITERLQNANAVYLTNYQGLTVAQSNDLRNRFRSEGVDFKVLKNTLIRRAMESIGGYDEVFDYLNGATAVAFTTDPSTPAKVLKGFIKDNDKLEFKAAYVDGAVFNGKQLEALTTLKSKDELVGDIIGLLLAPASNIIGAIQSQGSNILGILKTIEEKNG
jgi:large subunit ribosomal protein L10